MFRRLVVSVVAAVSILGAAPASSAAPVMIPGDLPLQPGAPLIDESDLDPATGVPVPRGHCTLNFVFKDRYATKVGRTWVRRTYIGTSSDCTTGVGQRARSPHVKSFGTVVYEDASYDNRFALIEIDTDKLKYVSRVMRGYGAAPRGYTTSDRTSVGDVLVTHGWPEGDREAGVTRYGLLASDDSSTHFSTVRATPILDRGSPVINVTDGKALGISTEYWGWPWPSSPTIEGLLVLLKNAGFKVTL